MNAALATDLHLDRKPSFGLWVVAAAVAILFHVAIGGAWYLMPSADDSDDENGAPAMEIGFEMAAPKVEQTDLPPGPESEEAAASTAQVEQTKKVEEVDRPKEEPLTNEAAERVVSPDTPSKPVEDKPDPSTVQTHASAESAAAEAAAPPPSETARVAEKSTAPAQGTGDSARRVITTWQKQLVAHLDRHKRYPPGGGRKSVKVVVSFTIDRLGHVAAASVLQSSGEPGFDEAAVSMVRRSDPVPAPPALIADEGLTFTVPVVFREGGGKR